MRRQTDCRDESTGRTTERAGAQGGLGTWREWGLAVGVALGSMVGPAALAQDTTSAPADPAGASEPAAATSPSTPAASLDLPQLNPPTAGTPSRPVVPLDARGQAAPPGAIRAPQLEETKFRPFNGIVTGSLFNRGPLGYMDL